MTIHNTKNSIPRSRGFSLIELMVTIGIFSVITGVVLANYRSYNKNSDFANTVENVYLDLRESQVYGAGGKRESGAGCGNPISLFNCTYGVHFVKNAVTYNVFIDRNKNRIMDAGESIKAISLGSGTTITSLLCIRSGVSVASGACINNYASVAFTRPSPDAFIAEFESPVNSNDGVEITISNGPKTAKIVVSGAGQMSIH